jgi:hypothetical protein
MRQIAVELQQNRALFNIAENLFVAETTIKILLINVMIAQVVCPPLDQEVKIITVPSPVVLAMTIMYL